MRAGPLNYNWEEGSPGHPVAAYDMILLRAEEAEGTEEGDIYG